MNKPNTNNRHPENRHNDEANTDEAQQQFIDTLLEATYRQMPLHRDQLESRVSDALDRIRHEESIGRRRPMMRFGVSLAASVLLALCAFWFVNMPTEATAEQLYRLALSASHANTDREYLVVTKLPSQDKNMTFKLHLRQNCFAVDLSDSIQKDERAQAWLRMLGTDPSQELEIWAGCDGEEIWMVPPGDRFPVYVSDDMDSFHQMLEKMNIGSTPWLTVDSVLQLLGDDYRLTLVPAPPAMGLKPLVTLRGGKVAQEQSSSPRYAALADQIDLLVDPDTGTVQTVDLRWTTKERPAYSPERVTFRLINEQRKPEDFYTHEAHHAPERNVMPFPAWMQGRPQGR